MKIHKCIECGEDKEANFYPNNKSRCKACCKKRSITIYHPRRTQKQAEYYKRWYDERGRKRPDNYKDVIVLWQSNHQDSVKASRKVLRAIREGLLERPVKCSLCGKPRKTNGHHEDYNSPYAVLWVCASCHKKIHLGLPT